MNETGAKPLTDTTDAVLIVEGDLDSGKGPIETKGSVRINGSVRPNLTVKAGGDVEVGGEVAAGAAIEARGRVTVFGSVVGDGTRIVSQSSVRAAGIQAADVMARGEIVVRGEIAGARIRSGARLLVEEGGIGGGQVHAVSGIAIGGAVGSSAGESTVVGIVADPEGAARLAKVHQGLEFCEKDIVRILRTLGMKTVSRGQIQAVFQRLPAAKRSFAIEILKQLNQIVKLREELLDKRAAHEQESAHRLEAAEISVSGTVFPGTRVRIGEQERYLDERLEAPVFCLADGEIRW